MSLKEFFTIVKSTLNYRSNLEKFSKDTLVTLLTAIGEQEVKAAIQSLNNTSISTIPTREITIAISNLELAYQRYESITNNSIGSNKDIQSIAKDLQSIVKDSASKALNPFGEPKSVLGNRKCCEISIVIAICYQFLNEFNLTNQYIETAKKHFYIYAEEALEHAELIDRNSFTVALFPTPSLAKIEKEKLNEEESSFLSICKSILEV